MKLLTKTNRLSFIWIIPVIIIGSIFCYYMIQYIVYEEADEYLKYEMNRIVAYHNEFEDLPDNHSVVAVIDDKKFDKPHFKDTLILETEDNEMVPYRELYFTIEHKGIHKTILLRHLLVGNDDIFEGTLWIILGLISLITIAFFLMTSYTSQKVWKPFYDTLHKIIHFKTNDPIPVFEKTTIDEFNSLNQTLENLLTKIQNDFQRTKEFNENASHELQTHLSVIRANAELLLHDVDFKNHVTIQKIHQTTLKLSKTQSSLLLLSKIGNQEFSNQDHVNFKESIESSLALFEELIDMREIHVSLSLKDCTTIMDSGLAEIMINNLVKNSVKHNIAKGFITISTNHDKICIENSGTYYTDTPDHLLERFKIGTEGNLGIGLSIVKQICDLYHFKISYRISENNIHQIEIIL